MKKYLITIALLLALIPAGIAIASDIFSAQYYGVIIVTKNGTATENQTAILNLDSQSLIDNYGVWANFDNTAVRSSAGADIPYGPSVNSTYPWCFWIDSIGANSNQNVILYTGNASMGATRYYFPGATGMSVDDFDIGTDNSSISVSGYFAGSGNVSYKEGAYSITYDETTANITATATPAPVLVATLSKYAVGTTAIDLSSLSIIAGDVLIVNATTYAADDVSYTAGWTELYETDSTVTLSSAYKVAAGGETSVTVTTAGSPYLVCTVAQIRGAAGGVEHGTSATGATANPDPPAVTPSWSNTNTMWIVVEGHQDASKTVSSYPANYTDGIAQGGGGASGDYTSMAFRFYQAASENPGTYTLSGADDWVSNTIAVQGKTISLTATGITAGEYGTTYSVNATSGNIELWVDGTIRDSETSGGALPDTANPIIFAQAAAMPYMESASIEKDGVLVGSWAWEYATTFTDLSGNGHTATPSFRTAASDSDITAVLSSWNIVSGATAPGYTVSSAPDFYTANNTTTSSFTGGTVSTGGPPGAAVIDDVSTAGGTPSKWLWGIVGMLTVIMAGLFISWMEREHGSGSGTIVLRMVTHCVIFGLLIAWGKFDFWMLVMYLIIAGGFAMMSRHTELRGNVQQLNIIGFCAQLWLGLTLINNMLGSSILDTHSISWGNSFAITQQFNLFGVFNVPVINFDFFTNGIPALVRWDYSMFGGNAQLIAYMMYSLTAVVSFMLFIAVLGLLYNFLGRTR